MARGGAEVGMVALALPGQVLRGIYLGVLTGIFPALIAFAFGFGFRYVTGVSIPAFAVVVLALALAGVNGGLLALADPAITQQANSVTLVTAVIVVLMLSLYTHAQGDTLAVDIPRRLSWERLRERTVSTDVVERVGGLGRVTVEVVGAVRDMEGYPPLPDSLRADIEAVAWQFPADLPLSELESRMAERLRNTFDLQDVEVRMDERGHASVIAAPPSAGVSSRVAPGRRAVSVSALIPTGIARGDRCKLLADGTVVEGVVVSARSENPARKTPTLEPDPTVAVEPESGTREDELQLDRPSVARAPTTTGGEGRITLSIPTRAAQEVLAADSGRVVVQSRGIRREFELLSLLRRAGQRIRRLTIGRGGPLDGHTLREAAVRDTYGVAILALRHEGTWLLGPHGDATVAAGDEVFVVGSLGAIKRFREAVA